MTKFKHQLDDMMGDTDAQERRIKQQVHNRLQAPKKTRTWQLPVVTAAITAVAVFLLMTMNPGEQVTTDEGRAIPYDPLDDLVTISTLHQKGLLSEIDYEAFAELPLFDTVAGLQYVDPESFTVGGETYHTVIERQPHLFDQTVYELGDVVRTMTNTTSHLPTFADVYYEVIAGPGDRIALQNGKLTVNGQALNSELSEYYEQQGNKILGDYEQILNAREYFLLNHFPSEQSVQGATITPVHKIYGKVVARAKEDHTQTIYFEQQAVLNNEPSNYDPTDYFDLYLYDKIFGTGEVAQHLTAASFAHDNRRSELFLEAAYRTAVPLADKQVELRYEYGRAGVGEYRFVMEQVSGIWRLAE